MPLPASVPTVTVTGTFYRQTGLLAGTPAAGTITFAAPQLRVAADNIILPKQSFTATLDANGSFSVVLLTTTPGYYVGSPNWAYSVSAELTDAIFTSDDYQIPEGYAPTVDLADLSPVTDPADCDLVTCANQEEIAVLQGEIEQEIEDRIAADDALQVSIDTEEAAREAADLILQGNIDTEEAARIAADAVLQIQINAMNFLTSGEEVMPRRWVNSEEQLVADTLHLMYFQARKTGPITTIFTTSGNASVGATLARIGVYSINTGTLAGTLVASTANDTALWSGGFTPYTPPLTTTFNKVQGNFYAIGYLWRGATPPYVEACAVRYSSAGFAPRILGELAGQTDLPGGFADAALSTSHRNFQSIMLP
jgi:hypothetical protein